jgi:tetratricopeptide (TPR) repeat protein
VARVRARALALASVLAAAALVAGPVRADDHDFWADVVDPHGDEVRMIVEKATRAEKQAESFASYDGDPTGLMRARLLDDAYGMLRYARRLAPHNPAVLLALGEIADDDGRSLQALEALHAYLAEVDRPDADAYARLGRIHLLLGHYGRAVHDLREALAGHPPADGTTTVYLAQALVASGHADDATQLLADAVDNLSSQYYGVEASTLVFALAVSYDQNEQLSKAYATLDHLQNALSSGYAAQLQQALARLDFVPAIDRHYWQGLLYETAGFYGEARAEWLNYAAAGPAARYRDRALAHVHALDQLRAAELIAHKHHPHPPPPPHHPMHKTVPHMRVP